MSRQITPHFISFKQSIAGKTSTAKDQVSTPEHVEDNYDRILKTQANKLDELLLNDGGLHSLSDANDSIFGGHSQMNNLSDGLGLRARRFDPTDCRISLHLNIEKSAKKKAKNQTESKKNTIIQKPHLTKAHHGQTAD